jgi:hypothetical protein
MEWSGRAPAPPASELATGIKDKERWHQPSIVAK